MSSTDRDEFRTILRLRRELANAAKHAAIYRNRSLNQELTLYTALGVAMSTISAADEQPNAPGAEEARRAAEQDFERLYRVAFRRPAPDGLFAASAEVA